MDPARPIFLNALVPDFHYVNGGRPQCDFKTYQRPGRVLDRLACRAASDCNRIVALHPSVDVESMRWIERDGIRISTWKTADMVPLCDVYVASISSTIRWAIGCGKPVVNYDVYRYRYPDFLGIPGVLAMEEQHEFRDALQRLAADEGYRRRLAEAQQIGGVRTGRCSTGSVGDRMIEVVARLSIVRPRRHDSGVRAEREGHGVVRGVAPTASASRALHE